MYKLFFFYLAVYFVYLIDVVFIVFINVNIFADRSE